MKLNFVLQKTDVNSTGNKLFLINAYASELHKEKHLSLKTTLFIARAFSVSECDFYTRQHTQGSYLARHRTEFKKNPCVKEKYHLYILVPVTELQWLSLKKLFFSLLTNLSKHFLKLHFLIARLKRGEQNRSFIYCRCDTERKLNFKRVLPFIVFRSTSRPALRN